MTVFQKPWQVAIALRDGTLTERAKLNFLWVLTAIVGIFGQDSALRALRTLTSGYGLILLVPWAILVWGIIASYRANRQGDNQNFIERFVCLTASSIRAYLAYAVLANLVLFLSRLIYASQSAFQFLVTQLAVIGITLYIYLRLKSLMSIAAGTDSARDLPTAET